MQTEPSCEYSRSAPRGCQSPAHQPLVHHDKTPTTTYCYQVHDDVSVQQDEQWLNYQIKCIKRNHNDTLLYYLIHEDARPTDALLVLYEQDMHNISIVKPWVYNHQETIISLPLLTCATQHGVCVFDSQYGKGLKACYPLKKGHLIPYWGKLSCLQRDGGCYNAQITDTIFVIADEPKHRGPGAFCNDNTVDIDAHGNVHSTQKKANAKLVWTIPNDHYLDSEQGTRMSNPITIM